MNPSEKRCSLLVVSFILIHLLYQRHEFALNGAICMQQLSQVNLWLSSLADTPFYNRVQYSSPLNQCKSNQFHLFICT